MPTYIYRCQTCEKEFEIIQSFKDEPLSECPSNCTGTVKKVFSGVGISFKGSGFYKNDHGANSKNKASVSTSKDSDNKSSESSKEKSTSDKQSGGSVKKETKAPGNAGSAKTDN